ncbi:MvaI/BcnI family restriction endonuclease [Thalassotalea euphylliae]|uniref:MvaI/BcnI family restriction endonuclease n=1 Tax=Thalassotalea euphylliae TaxID=1655234 RepID=UPI00362BA71C
MKKLSTYKKEAKTFQKKHSLKLHQAQLLIAQEYGFNDWPELVRACENQAIEDTTSQQVDMFAVKAIAIEDSIEPDTSDDCSVESEREEDLTFEVKERVLNNKRKLVSIGQDFATFEPTATGLKKSILDATQPVRTLFSEAGFHDYESQGQGPENKVMKKAIFISKDKVTETVVSLYRPNTKMGDPRMWFRGLGKFAEAGAQVSLSIAGDDVLLINLSNVDLNESNSQVIAKLLELIPSDSSVADELLDKLKILARGEPLRATVKGSTAVGRAIETALGININSSKEPDYKGIELKSGRGTKNRTTLFAQVADWKISPLKKSAEILDQFGYYRDEDFKLYCTLSTKKPNSQGLQFVYDEKSDLLTETNVDFGDVAVWPGKLLRSRLLEKHKETFWVQVESIDIDGVEHFKLISVTHTKNPMSNQLMPLLRDGIITMDHLIKRRAKDGRVSEKGPLFKINKKDLSLLFPEPETYSLL